MFELKGEEWMCNSFWELYRFSYFVWQWTSISHFTAYKIQNVQHLFLSFVLAHGRWVISKRSWRSPRGFGPTCQMTSVPRASSQSLMRNSVGTATLRAGEDFCESLCLWPMKSPRSPVITFYLPEIKITTLCSQINTFFKFSGWCFYGELLYKLWGSNTLRTEECPTSLITTVAY